ncbi:hypothetical protein EXIGLDRAFT_837324 [Exidia glandulosa HHB12029]|uniref:Uncharacterized protein n=1 Tax=Exidia glandulosa HHB12029 TaxID=1314781 RepID=A0A165GWR3_EXIGL|nr:hypothetical protein EXIGLDRAFT_837324 [Exidia glandulosa HHB12029]
MYLQQDGRKDDPAPLFPQPPSDGDDRDELSRVWAVVADLSEQLNRNRALASSLQAQAGHIKNQAVHAQSGFPLRRFNGDVPKDLYEEELERMTTSIREQNVTLAHDNKQLANLVREYEATLEAVMSKFRQSALEAQERELGIARMYETALLARDDRLHTATLGAATSADATVAHLGGILRSAMRALQGEVDGTSPIAPATPLDDMTSSSSSSSFGFPLPPSSSSSSEPAPAPSEPQSAIPDADTALERDCELARLERENAELRRMLGSPLPDYPYSPSPPLRAPTLPRRFPSLRTSGLGVYNPFPGSGGAMGIGMGERRGSDGGGGGMNLNLNLTMLPSPGGVDFSPENLWREQERARENREALLS